MAGDEIVFADGTYPLTANVTCDAVGTDTAPIVVRAENPPGPSGGDAGLPADHDDGGGCCQTGRRGDGSVLLAAIALGYALFRRRRD